MNRETVYRLIARGRDAEDTWQYWLVALRVQEHFVMERHPPSGANSE